MWLGGLVNPGALLTALRQERAILDRVGVEDVGFECVVMSGETLEDMEQVHISVLLCSVN